MKIDKNNGDDSKLWPIVRAVVDGDNVDWDTAESSAPESERPILHKLRVISKVAKAHRKEHQPVREAEDDFDVLSPSFEHRSWGPLEILEKIGEGAFGEVLRARDRRLDREVALKLIHPDRVRHSRQTTEVIEEGRLLARIQHPNVVTVYGAEEHDGRVGIWMELIKGFTLEKILRDKGILKFDEAMLIGRDICRALTSIHKAGVIHRDIKPRNIMCDDEGRYVLMDLGVSCEIDREVPVQQYGTPLFAAPEVLLEGKATPQGDIYSVGVLLFHLVTGEYPVSGITLDELRKAHETSQVKLLRDVRTDFPEAFIRVVDKALAPKPTSRFASAGQFEQALKDALGVTAQKPRITNLWQWTIPVAVILILSISIGFNLDRIRDWLGTHSDSRPSLAVLFFDNLGPTGEDDFIAAGLTEDITTSLSQINQLDVLSRSATERFRGEEVDPQEVGRILDIDYVLEGSIRRSQDILRVTVQLIDTENGFHVWAENFDGAFTDIFAIQDTIAARIGAALKVSPTSVEYPLVARRWTENAEAYAYFLVGREKYWNEGSPQASVDARPWLEKALELDASYAPALAQLAYVLTWHRIMSGRLEPSGLSRALDLAREAQRLEPSLAIAWRAEGGILWQMGEIKQAQRALEHAIELNPKLAESYKLLGDILWSSQGRSKEAIEILRQGIAADPYFAPNYRKLNEIYRSQEAFSEAEHLITQGLTLSSQNPLLLCESARILRDQTQHSRAVQTYRHLLNIQPDYYPAYIDLGNLLRRIRRSASADSLYSAILVRWHDVPRAISDAGWHAHRCRRYKEAESMQRSAINMDINSFRARWRLAHSLYYQGRKDEAERAMLEILNRWPDFYHTYNRLCTFYFNVVDDPLETEKWAVEMQRRFPQRATSYSWLGWTYSQMGKSEKAIQFFERAIEICPNNHYDYSGLWQCYRQSGEHEDALAIAKRRVEIWPHDTNGWNTLGITYRSIGHNFQAAAAYEKALEIDPFMDGASIVAGNLSSIYGDAGRYQKQIEILQRATKSDSTDPYPWRLMSESAWYGLQDSSLARRTALTAIELASKKVTAKNKEFESAAAHLILGDIASIEGNRVDATKYYQFALNEIEEFLERNQAFPPGRAYGGRIFTRNNEFERGLECARWLLDNQRQDAQLCFWAACIFSATGDTEMACVALEAAVAAGYHSKGYLLNVPDLDNLRSDARFEEILDSIR